MRVEKSKEDKGARILTAASAVFKGRRFDDVTLEEISEKAGVGKGTLYLYFKNKEDLFAQMAIDGLAEMEVRICEIMAMNSSYKERLYLFGRELADFLSSRHGVMRAMNQAQSDVVEKIFHKQLGRLILVIHELLQTGMDEGALRKDFQVAELRVALVGPILLKVQRAENAQEAIDLNALLNFFWAGAAENKL